ncbi:MAG: NlpC/P60 family protein [Thermoleophilia bacterium]
MTAALFTQVGRRSPARRAVLAGTLVVGALIVGLPLVAVLGLLGAAGTAGFAPSTAAIADIPASYLTLYEQAAAAYGIDWAIVAAVGKIECDHGRNQEPGCRFGTANSAGAVGPMQFLASTWARGHALGETAIRVPPTQDVSAGYATDGDGDGIADVWNPADAIHAAARYLEANGAPGDYRRALFAYNHATWYVDAVLERAGTYRGALGTPAGSAGAAVAWAARYLGTPYVWGGNHGYSVDQMRASEPTLELAGDGRYGYFDCSSLVAWAYASTAGIAVGDTTYEQWAYGRTNPGAERGTTVPPDGLRAGDLVFFHGLTHVGLFVGDDTFVHASHTGDDVKLSRFSTYGGFDGYVRYRQLTP